MSPDTAELVKTMLQLLLGPGGVFLVWLSLRSKGKLPRAEVEAAETVEAVQVARDDVTATVVGVESRWRDYADQMEARLQAVLAQEREARAVERAELARRLSQVEQARTRDHRRLQLLERRERALIAYADRLRAAINTGTARPPAETWPPELNLTPSRWDDDADTPTDGSWDD